MSANGLISIRAHLKGLYNSVSSTEERWKHDHAQAMDCFDLEVDIKMAVCLFDALDEIDEAWRLEMAEGRMEYDAEVDRSLDTALKAWLRTAQSIERRVKLMEVAGFDVAKANDFRDRLEQATDAVSDK